MRKFSDQFLSIILVILSVLVNLVVFSALQKSHTMIKRSRLIYKLIVGTGRHERSGGVPTNNLGANSW